MEKDLNFIELYYIYGSILTLKQRKTFELYYISDLSLREIAENEKITFQAVRNCIKTVEKELLRLEESIKMNSFKDEINQIYSLLKKEDLKDKNILKRIKKIRGV